MDLNELNIQFFTKISDATREQFSRYAPSSQYKNGKVEITFSAPFEHNMAYEACFVKIWNISKNIIKELIGFEVEFHHSWDERDEHFFKQYQTSLSVRISLCGFSYYHQPSNSKVWVDLEGKMDAQCAVIFHPYKERYVKDLVNLKNYLEQMTITKSVNDFSVDKERGIFLEKIKSAVFEVDKILNSQGLVRQFEQGDECAWWSIDRTGRYCELDYLSSFEIDELIAKDFNDLSLKHSRVLNQAKEVVKKIDSNIYVEFILDDEKGNFYLDMDFSKLLNK